VILRGIPVSEATAQEASVSRPFLADSPTPRGQAGMPDLLLAANSACTVSLPEQLQYENGETVNENGDANGLQ
jgi:hypothetical protein